MMYMGSKRRIAKHILPIMLEAASLEGITTWIEPFVGGGNLIDKVPPTFERIGVDYNPHTIEALKAIRDTPEQLPEQVSEELYKSLKGGPPEPINSWVRFVCSFGGRLDAGFARGRSGNYAAEGKRSALKQSPHLQDVELTHGSYEVCTSFKNCLIYCDPPYEGTTKYKTGAFDHAAFWQWCRVMSLNNVVFVSEYNAPDDFYCAWEGDIKTGFSSTRTAHTHKATEKLFRFNDLY